MVIITGILAIIIAILSIRLYSYRVNIKSICRQLSEILEEDTNQLLVCENTNKVMYQLINHINEIIKSNKKHLLEYKKLNKKFKESITSISHDIRTPLTSAGGYIQMIKSNLLTEEEKNTYINIIMDKFNALKLLLDQLFEYARLEGGEIALNIEAINAENVFTDTLALYYEAFCKKGIEPQITLLEKKCMIQADVNALKRVFSNILYNALVHGEERYKMSVEEQDEYYVFCFSNKAEPISEEELSNIFERFYIHDTGKEKKTTGLGLAIAKRFVEQMEGKIYAKYRNELFSVVVELKKDK